MSKNIKHRIKTKGETVTALRARIEHKLGIDTVAEPSDFGVWFVYFDAPEDVNLDFLRPDVLPYALMPFPVIPPKE